MYRCTPLIISENNRCDCERGQHCEKNSNSFDIASRRYFDYCSVPLVTRQNVLLSIEAFFSDIQFSVRVS